MKKVRPMVDMNLREYVLSKFNHEFSFNASLRMLLSNQKLSNAKLVELTGDNSALKQEIAKLHNEKAGLNGSIKDVEDNCIKIFNQVAPTMEVIAGLMMGIGIGLLVGVFFL